MALYGLRAGAGDPVRRLHLPGVRPDRERAGEVPLPLGRRVPGAGRDPHAGRRRHPRRALPLAVARGAVHPHRRPQGRRARRTRTTPRACCSRRSATDDPVLFFEPKRIYRAAQGRGARGRLHGRRSARRAVVRAGHAASRCIAWGAMLYEALEAARSRPPSRASTCEVIDLRTLWPLDIETIVASREEDRPRRRRPRGAARRAASAPSSSRSINEKAFLHLEAPIRARHRLRHAVPVHARERVPARSPDRVLGAIVETARY